MYNVYIYLYFTSHGGREKYTVDVFSGDGNGLRRRYSRDLVNDHVVTFVRCKADVLLFCRPSHVHVYKNNNNII